jgi:hypothetical protein
MESLCPSTQTKASTKNPNNKRDNQGCSHEDFQRPSLPPPQRVCRLCRLCLRISPPAGSWQLKPIILATRAAEIRTIVTQSQPGQIVLETLFQKKPNQKWADRVAQVVEHLSSKHEAFSSNPSTYIHKKRISLPYAVRLTKQEPCLPYTPILRNCQFLVKDTN